MARWLAAAAMSLSLAACGTSGPVASVKSPSASLGSSPAATPTPTLASQAPASPSSSPIQGDPLLVIADFSVSEVRLARLDATDIGSVKGNFDGIVGGQVIAVDGSTLRALGRDGSGRVLGQLVGIVEWLGEGTVVVNHDLTQWLYATVSEGGLAQIHLGSAQGDRVVATLKSPDGNGNYRPFAWNQSGVLMQFQPVGLGGAGPFLEYHFRIAQFDMNAGVVTDISPMCTGLQAFDDGTLICGQSGALEVRPPGGPSRTIRLSSGIYAQVRFSSDRKRLAVARNGSTDPVINYQVAVAGLTASSAQPFGPLDFVPDAWLPDGRLVADHLCISSDFGGGPCDASLDGTYIFAADGASHTLFFKLKNGSRVVGYV